MNHTVILYYTTSPPGSDGSLSQADLTAYYQSLEPQICPIDLEPMNFDHVVMSAAQTAPQSQQPARPVEGAPNGHRRRLLHFLAAHRGQPRPTEAATESRPDLSVDLQSLSIAEQPVPEAPERNDLITAASDNLGPGADVQPVGFGGEQVSQPLDTLSGEVYHRGEQATDTEAEVVPVETRELPQVEQAEDDVQAADITFEGLGLANEDPAGPDPTDPAEDAPLPAAQDVEAQAESARAGVFPKCGHVFTLLPQHLRFRMRTCPMCRHPGQMVSLRHFGQITPLTALLVGTPSNPNCTHTLPINTRSSSGLRSPRLSIVSNLGCTAEDPDSRLYQAFSTSLSNCHYRYGKTTVAGHPHSLLRWMTTICTGVRSAASAPTSIMPLG